MLFEMTYQVFESCTLCLLKWLQLKEAESISILKKILPEHVLNQFAMRKILHNHCCLENIKMQRNITVFQL